MKIKYFAWIKDITKTNFEEINDDSIKDIQALKLFLCKKYPKLKLHMKKNNIIRIAINLEHINKNKKIHQNDEIAFFPPVSGG